MTTSLPDLKVWEWLDITEHHDGTAVVDALKKAVAQFSPKEHVGISWVFQLGKTESLTEQMPMLIVGVRGQLGALDWYEADGEWAPANGANEEETNGMADDAIRYMTPSGHEAAMPAHSEVPVAEAYAALEEWVRTHERPTCVRWQAVPDSYSG